MIDIKTEHFPIRKHILAPFMEMLASTAGLSLKNSPTFSEKRGEISKKSPIFYFRLSRYTFETAMKSRISPTKS